MFTGPSAPAAARRIEDVQLFICGDLDWTVARVPANESEDSDETRTMVFKVDLARLHH